MKKYILLLLVGILAGLAIGYGTGYLSGFTQKDAEWKNEIIRCANEIGAAGRFAEFEIRQENGELQQIRCGSKSTIYR